jgi:O-acetyl-ADP-ribose deacetylase (regulator of RNase III)
LLYEACRKLKGCATGDAKITPGFQLPAKYVIHTVGPIWKDGNRGEDEKLASCYRRCFEIMLAEGLKTIAFPAISTGAYGFPLERATRIAMEETHKFLETNPPIEKIIFVCFTAPTSATSRLPRTSSSSSPARAAGSPGAWLGRPPVGHPHACPPNMRHCHRSRLCLNCLP